jgi:hypothetical protein
LPATGGQFEQRAFLIGLGVLGVILLLLWAYTSGKSAAVPPAPAPIAQPQQPPVIVIPQPADTSKNRNCSVMCF